MKSKVFKSIAAGVSVLMAIVLVAGMVMNTTLQTEAADTLKGIKDLITKVQTENQANPDKKYTILEVVPNESDAEIGYLFDGFEPGLPDWRDELLTRTDASARQTYMNDLITVFKTAYQTKGLTDSGILNIGTYVESTDPVEGYEALVLGGKEESGHFEKSSGASDMQYAVTFVKAETTGDTAVCYYAANSTQLTETDIDRTDITGSTSVYIKNDAGAYVRVSSWQDFDKTLLKAAEVISEGDDADGDSTEVPADSLKDTVTNDDALNPEAEPTALAEEGLSIEEVLPAEEVLPTADAPIDYYLVNFEAQTSVPSEAYVVNGYQKSTDGEYSFIKAEGSGNQIYTIDYGTVYYSNPFQNQEWFKKYVLNMNPDEYTAFPVKVVTCTPDELKTSMQDFDFLYLKGDLDLDETVADTLYSKVTARKLPCVFDSGMLDEKTADAELYTLCTKLTGDVSEEILNETPLTFATNNVYVLEKGKTIVNKDFATPFCTDEKTVTAGFQGVLDEIKLENLYREAESLGKLDTKISEATVLRHIMNYQNHRENIVRKNLRVLEIQPVGTQKAEITLEKIQQWASGVEKITVTRMTTAEFAGRIDTLNDKYDLIYIGTNAEYMNTNASGTTYNDTALNGLIYHKTGDIRKLADGKTTYSYSSNDITEAKKTELLNFLKGSYPVILSDDFFVTASDGTRSVNDKKIEKDSWMYAFAKEALAYNNLYAEGAIEADSEFLRYYLNSPKVQMAKLSVNGETKDGEAFSRLRQNADGKYYLEYHFIIQNDGVVPADTKYRGRLYIDLNGDGRFDGTEELGGLKIKQGSTEVSGTELYAGQEYVLEREVPKNYGSVLSWNLKLSQVKDEQIYCSASGYTKLVEQQPEKVKILQLSMGETGTLNLNTCFTTAGNAFYDLVHGGTINDVVYAGIDTEYDLDVTYQTVNECSAMLATNTGYLEQFDMMILGFSDTGFPVSDAELRTKIKAFAESGKSVIYTHDTTEFWEGLFGRTALPTYKRLNEQTKTGENGNTYLNVKNSLLEGKGAAINTPRLVKLNQSVISSYPYLIGNEFTAAKTHGQNVRLNQDTDAVVWYCLGRDDGGETMYSLSPNDAVNNYYIYSQGNVIYSGFGCTAGYTLEEAKLFINTIIAAYHNGIKAPSVKVLENGMQGAPEMKVMYRYFDGEADSASALDDADYEKLYFTVKDENFATKEPVLTSSFYYKAGTDAMGTMRPLTSADGVILHAAGGAVINSAGVVDGNNVYALANEGLYYLEVPKTLFTSYPELKFYFGVQSSFEKGTKQCVTNKVYAELEVLRAYLFDLD